MTEGSLKDMRTVFARAGLVWLVLLAAYMVIAFLFTGIYSVQENEQGVVLRFGAVNRRVSPGLAFTLPWPFEELIALNTRETRKMPVGFRFVQGADPTPGSRDESEWLTGDINVIDVEMMIHYSISDPEAYLFRIGPVHTDFLIRKAAESVLTETLGVMSVDAALTTEKLLIEQRTRERAQALLDRLGAGAHISRASLLAITHPADEAVARAFKDVSSAKADRERALQEADGYSREVETQARAQAAQIIEQARVYESTVVSAALGKAERFKSLYAEYAKAPGITRTRLFLDTMTSILVRPRKIVVDLDADGEAGVKIIK